PVEEAGGVSALGSVDEYIAEWKLDGIRAQLIRRGGGVALWSRGDELLTERFPEITEPGARLPAGTVLDGEVLAMRDGKPLAFSVLQRRIGRTNLTRNLLSQAPAGFVAYDVLEVGGVDVRERPLSERRALLEDVLAGVARIGLSERLVAGSWEEIAALRTESRGRNVEGLMLKRLDSAYGAGRKRGAWWKWKIDPLTVDAVLVYAQPGHGRRAGLLTDYTFAVWDGGELVPFAKAYSGLDQAEIDELDRWIRGHSTGRFGPVRVVAPERVYELGFEAIAPSPRHRAGVAVRFPRILRWRTDKAAADADTLASLRALIPEDRVRGNEDQGPSLFE
ncbi:MAG: cisplatin damage response ATP-dependent DNA ligase, partial [Phycisphaerales bacterium]|nr:cisplatin damage response ATP-dependent DNA ligase [Phycisphaerales bacterium]